MFIFSRSLEFRGMWRNRFLSWYASTADGLSHRLGEDEECILDSDDPECSERVGDESAEEGAGGKLTGRKSILTAYRGLKAFEVVRW